MYPTSLQSLGFVLSSKLLQDYTWQNELKDMIVEFFLQVFLSLTISGLDKKNEGSKHK
jgi:hypothetical protein